MKAIGYLIVVCWACFSMYGCGGGTGGAATPVAGADVIQAYKFTVTGEASTTTTTLPQQFTDPDWDSKRFLCDQAGYDLTAYAGQVVSLTSYSLVRKRAFFITLTDLEGIAQFLDVGQEVAATLWVITKDGRTIGAYLALDVSALPLLSLREV